MAEPVWLLVSWYGPEMRVLSVFSSHGRATTMASICQEIEEADVSRQEAEAVKRYPHCRRIREELRVWEMLLK